MRFCFLIGAGASKSSGIKTGWELSAEWYEELKEDLEKGELAQWEQSNGFDKERVGEFYPLLYEKRYEASPELGYDRFKELMESSEPSLGYVILSQILANEKHNFVITTNFDYLIEDAVRMYTSTKPFVAGHELLAEFVSSQTDRPTIIKVHRDLFLNPFNDDNETSTLKEEWDRALSPILKNFHLLVIGYGGNDGSLMDYLQNIAAEERKPIYWCGRSETNLNDKIRKLLTPKDYTVTISGFDELMYALNSALGYNILENLDKPDDHPFLQATKKRLAHLNDKLNELLENSKSEDQEAKLLFTGSKLIRLKVYLEDDPDKKESIYQEGLKQYPNDANLLGNYALFLFDIRKDYDKAESYYQKAIELDPKHANNLGNYAVFLSDIRKDYDKAESYYQKAMELVPDNADFIGNYAIFLKDIRKDYDKAESYYQKAIELDPENANKIGSYAIFLFDIRKDYDKAESYYQKAIELDPDNAVFLGNYALFLSDISKDYNKAEDYYQKAIKLDPKNMNIIGNYANLLSDIRKDYDKAESYYQKAIKLDPKNMNIIGNYANLLSNIRKDYEKAESYYQKAIELDPRHANNIGNYAHFIITAKQDFQKAEKLIDKAFTLEEGDNLGLLAELWFYRYAHYQQWFEQAEKELGTLVEQGAKSPGWDFQSHIEIAKQNGTSDIHKLEEFAHLLAD